MTHQLPPLPYNFDALAPLISKETLEFHYGKHHKTYVENLNQAIQGTPFEKVSLDETMLYSTGKIFNNAAQAWNHTFYWNSLAAPSSSAKVPPELLEAINKDFGSFEHFQDRFKLSATQLFGSGWTWLVMNRKTGKLQIENTMNAENPVRNQLQPLFTCDVWEHAYYIDHKNARPKYLESFWKLVNWDFAFKNFQSTSVFAVESSLKIAA